MNELIARSRSVVAEASNKVAPAEYLRSVARNMTRDDLETLAVAYLLGQVKQRARSSVLAVERDATEKTPYRQTPEEKARMREREIEWERERRESNRALWGGISQALEKYKADLRVEWNRELLDSEFALGDGTTTTWGDATREQHQYRIDLHKGHAIAGLEGAARHQLAIDEMDGKGVTSLRQAVTV